MNVVHLCKKGRYMDSGGGVQKTSKMERLN